MTPALIPNALGAPTLGFKPETHGRLVYAIGDIHGNLDLAEALVESITIDALRTAPNEKPVLIFLGDYVDRGADSAGVIDLVIELQSSGAFEVRALKGNHEEAVLCFLEEASFGPAWVAHGGGPTLRAYGVPTPSSSEAAAWEATKDAFAAALPATHLAFLQSLEVIVQVGDYVFVHAGLRPGIPIDQQSERDLLWIREEFLSAEKSFDLVVVHGHTPSTTPQIKPHRLGIDTGAYATGVLTGLRLEGPSQCVMQSRIARPMGRT